jgi:hypothetical protein
MFATSSSSVASDPFASTKTCIARITDDAYTQKFGNGRNNFYIELRCHGTCVRGLDVCLRCAEKSASCKNQTSRKFPHGNVNEPIPEASHIFGGTWYEEHVGKYGKPTEDVLQFALEHQRKARDGFPLLPPVTPLPSVTPVTAVTAPKKRSKKFKIPEAEEEEKTAPVAADKKPAKKRVPREPPNPYSSLIQANNAPVHKEVAIPTHLETSLEQFDTEGFRIEYVKLTPFEHGGVSYYRDDVKHKLYRAQNKKVGDYAGRYDAEREEIRTDIPDSDDEDT